MASAFGHAFSAVALGSGFPKTIINWKFWTLGMICSILPDADVISFQFGIPYEAFWGHRGFTHSLLFALLVGVLFAFIFYWKKMSIKHRMLLMLYFFLCTASHAMLDAMTNGGLGIAFFSPWDNGRYFFPWRPIYVSPIGIANFFSESGLGVIRSELTWIGIPGVILMITIHNFIKSKQDK